MLFSVFILLSGSGQVSVVAVLSSLFLTVTACCSREGWCSSLSLEASIHVPCMTSLHRAACFCLPLQLYFCTAGELEAQCFAVVTCGATRCWWGHHKSCAVVLYYCPSSSLPSLDMGQQSLPQWLPTLCVLLFHILPFLRGLL